MVKGEGKRERERGWNNVFLAYPATFPTVPSESKSTMAGQINNRELVTRNALMRRLYCSLHMLINLLYLVRRQR